MKVDLAIILRRLVLEGHKLSNLSKEIGWGSAGRSRLSELSRRTRPLKAKKARELESAFLQIRADNKTPFGRSLAQYTEEQISSAIALQQERTQPTVHLINRWEISFQENEPDLLNLSWRVEISVNVGLTDSQSIAPLLFESQLLHYKGIHVHEMTHYNSNLSDWGGTFKTGKTGEDLLFLEFEGKGGGDSWIEPGQSLFFSVELKSRLERLKVHTQEREPVRALTWCARLPVVFPLSTADVRSVDSTVELKNWEELQIINRAGVEFVENRGRLLYEYGRQSKQEIPVEFTVITMSRKAQADITLSAETPPQRRSRQERPVEMIDENELIALIRGALSKDSPGEVLELLASSREYFANVWAYVREQWSEKMQNEMKGIERLWFPGREAGETLMLHLTVGNDSNENRELPLDMVWCPPGSFLQGASEEDPFMMPSRETPQHDVELTRGFWICRVPVTQKLYSALVRINPSALQNDSFPVTNVSWNEAISFCEEFTASLRRLAWGSNPPPGAFRLPTEAEWEYACRAGSSGPHYGELDEIAWHEGNSHGTLQPVAMKKPNAWGLTDTLGNVTEWCLDDWIDTVYTNERQVDPLIKKSSGVRGGHPVRGGSFMFEASTCRASARTYEYEGQSYDYTGFRMIFVPPSDEN